MSISSLKKRKDFVDIAENGKNAVSKGLVLQVKKRDIPAESYIEVGYTASGRLGNAVIRNRIKRRLRVLAQQILPEFAKSDYKYVIIGRKAALDRCFNDLKKDLKYALHSTNTHK